MEPTLTAGPLYGFDADREHEDRRLIAQARLFDPLTAPHLREAGLAPGMHVLDLGSGAGDTALLAAGLVGPTGSVLGLDRSPAAITLARRRVTAAGLANVDFVEGDAADLDDVLAQHPEIDAVLGRLILMWVPDPVAVLAACARGLRRGGLICFAETRVDFDFAVPRLRLWDQTQYWVEQVLSALNVETRMGPKLHRTFRAAGLPAPQLRGSTIEASGEEAPTWFWVNILRGLAGALETHGIASADDLGLDTLEQRLRSELLDADGVMSVPPLTVAWARVPG
jgi:SAM-dependent methyltransferase